MLFLWSEFGRQSRIHHFDAQVAEVEDTTSGGLLLTSGSSEKPTLGKVCKLPRVIPLGSGVISKMQIQQVAEIGS